MASLPAPRECPGAGGAAGSVAAIGFLPTTDFNLARGPPLHQLAPGEPACCLLANTVLCICPCCCEPIESGGGRHK